MDVLLPSRDRKPRRNVVTQPLEGLCGPLLRRLESIAKLDDDDRKAVRELPIQYAQLRADQDIVREGDRPTRSCILLSGMTYWSKNTHTGKRQITFFSIAGDIPDLQSLYLSVMDSNLMTLTPCELGFVQHEVLRRFCTQYPRVAAILWKMTLIEGAIFREWVTNVGSRSAYTRIAHLLCELMMRFKVVGLAGEDSCVLPLTQAKLGEATGLSIVHVNRSLQALRQEGLITLKAGELRIRNWEAMAEAGDFDPTFLHLERNETR